MLAVGVGILLSPLFGGGREIVPAAIGPLMAGGINLTVALGIRRRLAPEIPVQVEMTRDAKSLLLALYQKTTGWPSAFGMHHGLRMRRMQRRMAMAGYTTAIPLPNDEVMDLLGSVAAAYNRISAAIGANRENPAIAKMAARVTLAADEVMAEVFHLAATLSRYPEGVAASRGKIEGHRNLLDEIAARLETLATTAESAPERKTNTSVEDVLAELRMEQLARSELAPEEEPRLRIRE